MNDKILFTELEKSTKIFLNHYEEMLKKLIIANYEKIYHTEPDEVSVQIWLAAQTGAQNSKKECPKTAIKEIADNNSSILLIVEHYQDIDRMHKELQRKNHTLANKIKNLWRRLTRVKKAKAA